MVSVVHTKLILLDMHCTLFRFKCYNFPTQGTGYLTLEKITEDFLVKWLNIETSGSMIAPLVYNIASKFTPSTNNWKKDSSLLLAGKCIELAFIDRFICWPLDDASLSLALGLV